MRSWIVLAVGLTAGAVASHGSSWAADAKVPAGQSIFLKNKCTSCHSIQVLGIEKKASEDEADSPTTTKKKPPDLSGVGLKHTAEWITNWLLKKETMDGEHHVKKFRGTDEELGTLANWLASLKTKSKSGKSAPADSTKPDSTRKSG